MSDLCRRRADCRLCGSRELSLVLRLTPTPPANAFVSKEEIATAQQCFPLDVYFCEECAHVQLLDVVDPRVLFENYVYVSGTSPVFVKHFAEYAQDLLGRIGRPDGALAVDIGSNDGTLLRFLQDAGMGVLGIDPARNIAEQATASGIETVAAFFDSAVARAIRAERGTAELVTANNVFAHVDDLAGVVAGIRELLAPDGLFAFEVSYLVDVFEKTLFDTIYHEHLSYHTVKPLRRFLDANGLELIDVVSIEPHGGSLRGIAQHAGGRRPVSGSVAQAIGREELLGLDLAETFHRFAGDIDDLKREVSALLRRLKKERRTIAGFGAPAKATTLMYHFDIGPEIVDFIIDDSPLKQNLFTPGMHIPVLPASELEKRSPDYVVILAWNFAESIMARHAAFRDRGGHFIVPLPDMEIH